MDVGEPKVQDTSLQFENSSELKPSTEPDSDVTINIHKREQDSLLEQKILTEQSEKKLLEWCITQARKHKIEISFMLVSAKTG